MESRWMTHKFCQLFRRFNVPQFYALIHTLSKASSQLFNFCEKPLYDNMNTFISEKLKTLTRKVVYTLVQEWLYSQEYSQQTNVLNSL